MPTTALAVTGAPRSYAAKPDPLPEPDTRYSVPRRRWVLHEDYALPLPRLGVALTIPAGFAYDGATIPRFCLPAISHQDLSEVAVLVHDWLYGVEGRIDDEITLSREEVDGIFLSIMDRQDVTLWQRQAAHRAVRIFGRHWGESPGEIPEVRYPMSKPEMRSVAERVVERRKLARAAVDVAGHVLRSTPSAKAQAVRVGLSLAAALWRRRKARMAEKKARGGRPGLIDRLSEQEALPAPAPDPASNDFPEMGSTGRPGLGSLLRDSPTTR